MYRLWVRGPGKILYHPFDPVYQWDYNGQNAWRNMINVVAAGYGAFLEWKCPTEVSRMPFERREPVMTAQ